MTQVPGPTMRSEGAVEILVRNWSEYAGYGAARKVEREIDYSKPH